MWIYLEGVWLWSISGWAPFTSTPAKSENTFHFERVWVDEQLADFGQLLNDARVIPTKKDGQPYFMFQYIKKESIYEQLGLKPKDIILEINGFVVDTVDKALKLLEVLQSEREIALMVEREGNPVKFHYYIDWATMWKIVAVYNLLRFPASSVENIDWKIWKKYWLKLNLSISINKFMRVCKIIHEELFQDQAPLK